MTDTNTICCVEVRFLDCVICSMETTDRGRAENYRDKMRETYWGAQVRIIEAPCPAGGTPLPDNSALWPLTVK